MTDNPLRPDDDETRRVIAVNSEYVVARGGSNPETSILRRKSSLRVRSLIPNCDANAP
jgi:hypothetical protein